MGMFDELKCDYPLQVKGANDYIYQTKAFPEPFIDRYIITKEGSLVHEDFIVEDHSVKGKWIKDHPGEPIPEFSAVDSFAGSCSKIPTGNYPLVNYTGIVNFYMLKYGSSGWIEWDAEFKEGKLVSMYLVKNEEKDIQNEG
jgi:hypothetical protein